MMIWDKALETGVDRIDNQHKELVNRVNAVLDASMKQKGKEIIAETLSFLVGYTQQHFRDEEQLQFQSGYPDAKVHKVMHDNYIKVLKEMVNRYQNEGNTLNMVLTINQNIVDWLVHHINIHDKHFSKYYKAKMKSLEKVG